MEIRCIIIMLATIVAVKAFSVTTRRLTCLKTTTTRLLSSTTTATPTPTTTDEMVHGRVPRKDLSMETRTLMSHLEMVLSHLVARRANEDTMEAAQKIVTLQQQRVALIQERDANLNKRKEASALVGKLLRNKVELDNEELVKAKEESTQATSMAEKAESELSLLETEQNALLASLPNLLDDRVPNGDNETQNELVDAWGSPQDLPRELDWGNDFTPKWHDDVATRLGGYQAEGAVRISGSRFVALSGDVARLERAIAMFFMDHHTSSYREVSVPLVVGRSALEGTSQLPKFQEDLFAIRPESHTCNGEDAFLIPTAEVPVTNLHRNEVLEEDNLPLSYVSYTPCFRAEAGSYGRDTKGLIRTHQFGKVELVKITTPATSDAEHESLTQDAESVLQALRLPYRKMRLCSGDIGFSALHCYDLEVWLPGANEYREISSCSNTGDFQAKRMGLRYRPNQQTAATDNNNNNNKKKKKARKPKPVHCHTINGSGLAVGRTLVAVLENYQKPDGSVVIPEVLRPYMGGKEILTPP